ncbi:histone acetylase complex subunit [Moniliophthora roreri]|uniref:Histone acetylase complex subunit n=1 Tax=Moniliophthora roreri TaxID=221103 RepID=A0A0W0FJZ5_MONRR|nr:histone acetylase complex subunit [Moniliophthora roreri]
MTTNPIDPMIHVAVAGDFEPRTAKIADPAVDLKTKHAFACEIREMLDTTRDSESTRVLHFLIPTLLELLRSGEPSFRKDSLEYQFRRVLIEILHRLPTSEAARPHVNPIFDCLFHLLRHDNEDNAALCSKALIDHVRNYRCLTEERLTEFTAIFQEALSKMPGLVTELLSEDSTVMDPNVSLPALRSFKSLAEMGLVMVMFQRATRTMAPAVKNTMTPSLEVVELESSAQKKERDDCETMGGIWAGMASTIKNAAAYTDFISAQIKLLSYLLYITKHTSDQPEYGERLTLAALRLLQDCPATSVNLRKDLMVVFRHLISTPHRRILAGQIDKLFDERILLGTGLGKREMLRTGVYTAVADLFHHLRGELTFAQLTRLVHMHLRLLHNRTIGTQVHILCAKILFGTPDTIVVKESSENAARLLEVIVDSCLDRLDALIFVHDELLASTERRKDREASVQDVVSIEQARPIGGASFAVEKTEEVIAESRVLFRLFLHGFRLALGNMKKCNAPLADGTLIFRMFEGCIKCMSYLETDSRVNENNDTADWFAMILLEINLHVFQEVWTHKIGFFFECAQKKVVLMNICQVLFAKESTSPTLLAIVLKFLVDRLPELGEYDDLKAAATIRLFKMAFGAVAAHPVSNEPILASHLARLLMDCFPLATKASKPTHYFHLLRALFRAIGGGGGRFELLYKEVLPLLPEMLDCLNRQLQATEGPTRDMIVELCLTVPLRLTHLLPHLSYLMQPLALALRGTPELISQGLRTLELCIDNLTPDFLDPTLSIVLRELMEALHSHLKPLPANHQLAHTTIRILGKLGGRNRRLLSKEPALEYSHHSDPPKVTVSFGGVMQKLSLRPATTLACRVMNSSTNSADVVSACEYLEKSLSLLANEGVKGRNSEDLFTAAVEAVYDGLHLADTRGRAETFLRNLSQVVFDSELRRGSARESTSRNSLLNPLLDAIPCTLARENTEQAREAEAVVNSIIQDLVALAKQNNLTTSEIFPILHQIANRFSALCFDHSWSKKAAGCTGIRIMTTTPEVGDKWVRDRGGDLVRTLLHVLKDLPSDFPDVESIADLLTTVLKITSPDFDLRSGEQPQAKAKLLNLAGIFFPELSSINPVVRQAVQRCIGLLIEFGGLSAMDLLAPHRERIVVGIYAKPLRALPFPIQIGIIEAVRFMIGLEPPLLELNDELLRLLHETLALADADDASLLGRNSIRQGTIEMTKLRVAAIKLLTASMPLTDFFSRQHQTRQRVTGVYFKSLYSPSSEVKDVAHEGLRMVLLHQSKLPKELLQTGLRPILMNLADPKRLSVPGLEGLARLLELLTNYFKVEIGHKLLDHFRFIADPQMLQASSRSPLGENEGITKLVRLANIFHLLPSSANIFLEDLVNVIVQAEAQMHFSGASPFSEPLAKYLDRYPVDGVESFIRKLQLKQHMRTLRSILQANLAPNLLRVLSLRTPAIMAQIRSHEKLIPALSLLCDLAALVPDWIQQHEYVMPVLIDIWRSSSPQSEETVGSISEMMQRHTIILNIFRCALQQSPRIDLLFEIITVYTRNLDIDLNLTTDFLYKHVVLSDDVLFQRNVLFRFLTWFDGPIPWSEKASFMCYVLTPTILVHAQRFPTNQHLIDASFVNRIHRLIWRRIMEQGTFNDADDTFTIEILHFTTVMIQYYPQLVAHLAKDLLRCSHHYIQSTEDPIVKQTAYLLNARFFAAFPSPSKFILRTWTGLLRAPSEGTTPQPPSALRSEGLMALAPSLSTGDTAENGYPQWAVTARRLLAEEGLSQLTIYYLMVKLPDLFYPVRKLFITYIVNSLHKLGLMASSTMDSRMVSIDLLQVIFNWERRALSATQEKQGNVTNGVDSGWLTPLGYRENMVSYLVRLTTVNFEGAGRPLIMSRALPLLQQMIGPNGWTDVAFGLRYFSKALEQNDFSSEQLLQHAIASAKVLQIIAAEQDDAWYTANASTLEKLIRKGMTSEDYGLHETLHPIFDRLAKLFPLPKEEEEQHSDLSDFHAFIYSAIGDGLRNGTGARGVVLMLKSVVQVAPERIEAFNALLMKLMSKVLKEHLGTPPSVTLDSSSRLLVSVIDICQISMAFLADQRRWLLSNLVVIVEKSKNLALCQYVLDLVRTWCLVKQDTYPTMKEKAQVLTKMVYFESKADNIFHSFLELVHEIYTEPTLRRSDLTSRLEPLFFVGCRAKDSVLRGRFMDLLDVSVPRSTFSRLTYILGVQNWEPLADHNWIYLAVHLLLGATESDSVDRRAASLSTPLSSLIPRPKSQSVVRPMQHLIFLDPQAAHDLWLSAFPAAWSSLSRREQGEITIHMINLLAKDYHNKQSEMRPNVIQTLLSGVLACSPPMTLPPHLVKYLAKTFGAWHIGLELLSSSLDHLKDDEPTSRDYVYDSLADVYSELAEEDLFYGLWRRRCLHKDTEIAIAYEQNGMWDQARNAYETAQNKARSSTIPFSESEYCLWEDQWILAAEKLQQWEILYDLGRNEGNHDLMLESAWRTKDWVENREALEEHISQLPEVTTPRRRVFEAFLALLKNPSGLEKNVEFTKILEDAMQMALRKWVALPPHLSVAHVPLLQHFQQFVELQEAVQIFASLSTTNAANLEKKSSDLKMVLQAWRERLPNLHDDISIWSDLVAWRQNVFHAINNSYIPLISTTPQGNGGASNTNTAGYRGYHETAWIINRFAHVARKHDLLDVCFTSLAKIYTLPNIEISEAFLKLREQARCYYQKPNELQAGLEVINNTNLVYFSPSQKAEFYTLKGMFHARFGRNEDANTAFGQAVQMDMSQAKSWAEWGRYNDRIFKEQPTELSHAANAVSCYLQAAGLYKNGKSRPLLTRVLWLLSVDDGSFTISRAFDTYKGDAAFWFWITLIPQLCASLSQREVKQARYLLFNLARHYPQALFFSLRTTREELTHMKRAAMAKSSNTNQSATGPTQQANLTENASTTDAPTQVQPMEGVEPQRNAGTVNANNDPAGFPRPTWDCVEEIVQLLKTAFPLLTLSLETIVDQLITRFKPNFEENIYHHIHLLLADAMQNYTLRMNQVDDDGQLSAGTLNALQRLAQSIAPSQIKREWEEDFMSSKLSHYEYIQRLQRWRDKFEALLDLRPRLQNLDSLSHYLTEFQYSKVDEIEVPGQYTEDKDNNQNFVRIQRLASKFDIVRQGGFCWRRITIIGSDNSRTSFTVQNPYHRSFKREDKVHQLFRTFNGVLARKKESRKRNLFFHIPAAVSCSPNIRLYQSDPSYISLSDVYDLHCQNTNIAREDPILLCGEKVRKVLREFRQNARQLSKVEYLTLKKGINDEVAAKMVPEDVLTKYMMRTMDGPTNLWRMRRQFTLQLASVSFMTFLLCVSSRQPARYSVSRSTGLIAMSDIFPGFSSTAPVFATNDVVPFRYTPALQHFIGPIFMEGILTSALMAIGRSLTEPEFPLEQQLCLFARDEVIAWLAQRNMPLVVDLAFRQHVTNMVEGVVHRAETVACKVEREQALQNVPMSTPVMQTVIALISSATNPIQLTKMGDMYYSWF